MNIIPSLLSEISGMQSPLYVICLEFVISQPTSNIDKYLTNKSYKKTELDLNRIAKYGKFINTEHNWLSDTKQSVIMAWYKLFSAPVNSFQYTYGIPHKTLRTIQVISWRVPEIRGVLQA